MTCPICIEKYQKIASRRCIKCSYCNYEACAGCVQTYLLGTVQEPHCMNCKNGWLREFLVNNFTATFVNKTYKEHRENILMAKERSLLPLRVVKVDRMRKGREMKESLKPLLEKIKKKEKRLEALRATYNNQYYNTIIPLLNGEDPDSHQKKSKNTVVCEFHKPCPADGCRGFLSTQYKCGICAVNVCADCYEIKTVDAEHVCKPENVESVKLKKKQCKNCPDCGAEIFKESGCEQMWCTQCQTTFDWKTGAKLVNVKIHNPHYYEYLQRTQGSVPRDPDDQQPQQQQQCYNHNEVLAILRVLRREIRGKNSEKKALLLFDIIRIISHISDYEYPRHRVVIDETTNEDIDLQYLMKEIDEKTWKQTLQNREKQNIKKTEILQILEMVVQATQDLLLACTNHFILEQAKNKKELSLVIEKYRSINSIHEVMQNYQMLDASFNKSYKDIIDTYPKTADKVEKYKFLLEEHKVLPFKEIKKLHLELQKQRSDIEESVAKSIENKMVETVAAFHTIINIANESFAKFAKNYKCQAPKLSFDEATEYYTFKLKYNYLKETADQTVE